MIRRALLAYPAAPLLAVALAFSACAKGRGDHPVPPPAPIPIAEAAPPTAEPVRPFQPAEPEPQPTPEEVRAIERPAVRK